MVVPVDTIGLDVGDRKSHACVMDVQGGVARREALGTTTAAWPRFFTAYPGARAALEAGKHSPWISRLLQGLGLEVIVANARKVRLIGENDGKNDPMDAELPVSPAHHMLGPFGPDCALRHDGQVIAAKGGEDAKKRAVVAVARKLAGLPHRLWMDGKHDEPQRELAEAA